MITSVTRGHNLKLFKFASSSSLRKNYFSNRVINEWYNLPATIVNAKSVIEFEKLYDDFCGNEKYNYEYAKKRTLKGLIGQWPPNPSLYHIIKSFCD